MREGWKLLRAPKVWLVDPLVNIIKEVPWVDAAVALADVFRGILTQAWDTAMSTWKPTWPNWLLPGATAPGTGAIPAPGGRPQPMPGSGGTTSPEGNYQPNSWEDKAYRAAVKANHPNPVEFVEQMRWESGGFNPDVISGNTDSSAGARGIAQIMPQYHPSVNPLDPDAALEYAANLMTSHYETYGNTDEALAAYNGGHGAVQRLRAGRPYGETSQYLSEVKGRTAEAQSSMSTVNMSGGEQMVTVRDQWGNEFVIPQSKLDSRPGGMEGLTVVGRKAADAAGTQTKPPASMANFGQSVAMGNQFELGLPYAQALAACGPAAVALFMQATGRTPNSEEVMRIAAKNGWTASAGMGGVGAFQRTLSDLGVKYASIPTSEADESVMAGNLTAISTGGGAGLPLDSGHYYVAQGYDPTTGKFDLGETGGPDPNNPNGQSALRSGSRYMTLDEIVAQSGPINGVVQLLGQIPPAANNAVASIAPIAPALATAGEAGQEGASGLTATTDAAGLMPEALAAGSEAATGLATNVQTSFDTMAVGSLQSVTDLGAGVLTTTQDMAGNTIATVTDMTGQVTSQSATLANGVSMNMGQMGVNATTSVNEMAGTITTVMTDAAGNAVTTVTDMSGKVVSQFATVAGAATREFGTVASAATGAVEPIESVGQSLDSIKAPDLSDIVDELKSVEKQAQKTAAAIKDITQAEKGGSKSGSGNSGLGKRHSGGPVSEGVPYLVGRDGAEELFVPGSSGYVFPGAVVKGGGSDGGIDYTRLANEIAAALGPAIAGTRPIVMTGTTEELARRVRAELREESANYSALRGM
jgi:hypothetical protein